MDQSSLTFRLHGTWNSEKVEPKVENAGQVDENMLIVDYKDEEFPQRSIAFANIQAKPR